MNRLKNNGNMDSSDKEFSWKKEIKDRILSLSPDGVLFLFLIEFITMAIVVQFAIFLRETKAKDFLLTILSEALAPNTIAFLTAIMGLFLIYEVFVSFKEREVFGSLSLKLLKRNCQVLYYVRATLINSIVILLAVKSSSLIIMQLNSLPLPNGLTYGIVWIYFFVNQVFSAFILYLMLAFPFINFKKHFEKNGKSFHKWLLIIYIFLGLGIFFIPLLSMGSVWK